MYITAITKMTAQQSIAWVPAGKTRDRLQMMIDQNKPSILLGHLPGQDGELKLASVALDSTGHVLLSILDAKGDGETITATIAASDHIKQIDAKLA